MKLCINCEEEFTVCDFCAHFRFNGKDVGSKHGPAYVDLGCCTEHFMRCDPDDYVCDWFECEYLEKYGEKQGDYTTNRY